MVGSFQSEVSLKKKKSLERLDKLENERSALLMEVSVLSEQVDAQSSKIIELENALQEKKNALMQMEETLQKERLSRSALETQKLELLSSLTELKLRQTSLEHGNLSLSSTNTLANGDNFRRNALHYSSLPRPLISKKGVMFDNEKTFIPRKRVNYIEPTLSPRKILNQLSVAEVEEWFSQLGLDSCINELQRWKPTGSKLVESSYNEIEKELNIKNALHKKKLFCAIEFEKCDGIGYYESDKMDNAAVLRWLDDIGLPQHKEAFHNAKIDGRVLHKLTTEDLLALGVNAQLHAASFRRGIQVLRELKFDLDNLERRPLKNMSSNTSNMTLWTNHRVMEWLRIIDLAEYAPNMRGSGVHGALIVYEPRFTSELMASLLSIPPAKTLLRRHLTTNFNQIVGRDIVQQKRNAESEEGFAPLTLTAKLKLPKKSQFTLKRKKSKNQMDFKHLVCPLEDSSTGSSVASSSTPGSPNLNSPAL